VIYYNADCRSSYSGIARILRTYFVSQVIVAGVSEDTLRKKLPQLAWGLARQGGSAAAQLARIAMLRLKPSLLLEQLLQTHCLCARNAKVIFLAIFDTVPYLE